MSDADDVLGDFFSELEKVEVEAVSVTLPKGVEQTEETSTVPPVANSLSADAQINPKIVAIEVKSAPAAPKITYASAPTTSTLEPPTNTQPTSSVPTFIKALSKTEPPPPAPPTVYPPPQKAGPGATPIIMTGSQMLAAAQPAIPQPTIPVQNKKFVRVGAGEVWVDNTLSEWPANDFRLFVGDLGNEVTTEMLAKEFQKYKTFAKAKVVRGGWNNKSKGYGFVSFIDPFDCAKALREMNGKYIGNRPMKLRKSTWKDNDINEVRNKNKKKRKVAEGLGLA